MRAFQRSGFTLIELLIVMAVIGVLASLLLTSFIGVRERARDGRRKSDINQIQAALEQYRADNADYITTPNYNAIACGALFAYGGSTYMQKLPCDPSDPSGAATFWNNGSYLYNYAAGAYTITACIENGSDTDPHISPTLPSGVTVNGSTACASGKYYTVNSP